MARILKKRKQCGKCGKHLTIDLFSKNKSRKDGYDHYCKACRKGDESRKEYSADYYQKHKARLDKKNKKYREEHKESLNEKSRDKRKRTGHKNKVYRLRPYGKIVQISANTLNSDHISFSIPEFAILPETSLLSQYDGKYLYKKLNGKAIRVVKTKDLNRGSMVKVKYGCSCGREPYYKKWGDCVTAKGCSKCKGWTKNSAAWFQTKTQKLGVSGEYKDYVGLATQMPLMKSCGCQIYQSLWVIERKGVKRCLCNPQYPWQVFESMIVRELNLVTRPENLPKRLKPDAFIRTGMVEVKLNIQAINEPHRRRPTRNPKKVLISYQNWCRQNDSRLFIVVNEPQSSCEKGSERLKLDMYGWERWREIGIPTRVVRLAKRFRKYPYEGFSYERSAKEEKWIYGFKTRSEQKGRLLFSRECKKLLGVNRSKIAKLLTGDGESSKEKIAAALGLPEEYGRQLRGSWQGSR